MPKLFWRICRQGLRQIGRDGMLAILLPSPFLMAGALRLLMPLASGLSARYLGWALEPWYSLADALVLTMAPILSAMIAAFLLLDEADAGTLAYYQITPAHGPAYLAARVGVPLGWGFLSSLAVGSWLSLTGPSWTVVLAASGQSAVQGLAIAMLIVALAGNKVEGLALSKVSGVCLIGLPWSYFAPPGYAWLAWPLPSYWLAEWLRAGLTPAGLAAGWATALAWAAALTRLGLRRLDRPAAG